MNTSKILKGRLQQLVRGLKKCIFKGKWFQFEIVESLRKLSLRLVLTGGNQSLSGDHLEEINLQRKGSVVNTKGGCGGL